MKFQSKSINCILNNKVSNQQFKINDINNDSNLKNVYIENLQKNFQRKIYFSSINKNIADKNPKQILQKSKSHKKKYHNTYSNGFKFENQQKKLFPLVKHISTSTERSRQYISSTDFNIVPKTQVQQFNKTTKLVNLDHKNNKSKPNQQLKEIVNAFTKAKKLSSSQQQNLNLTKRNKLDITNSLQNNLRIQFQNVNSNVDQLMEYYNRKIGAKTNDKIFILNSQDDYIRRILIHWGWKQNKVIDSPFFNLKWAYTDNVYQYSKLLQGQYFNHFKNNQQLTSKGRLLKNLKNNPNSTNISINSFFPKSFDLGNIHESDQFILQYQKTTMFIILRKHYNYIKQKLNLNELQKIQNQILNKKKLKDNNNYRKKQSKFSKQNKFLLLQFEDYRNRRNDFLMHINLIVIALKYLKYMKKIQKDYQEINPNHALSFKKQEFNANFQHLLKYSRINLFNTPTNQKDFTKQFFATPSPILIYKLIKYYNFFKNKYSQVWQIEGYQNIWIIKPSNNSKGNGIYLHRDKEEIISSSQGMGARIIQKYIEQPLIIKNSPYNYLNNRKFDIRQWILVTSYNPLTIYYFSSCYIRICSENYDINQIKSLQRHLTNYTFNKNNFVKKQQSVMSLQKFQQIIQTTYQKDWDIDIKPKIKNLIVDTIKCCSQNIQNSSQSFQMYGFDILLDKNLNPWLLEVNLSPACEQRCQFIKQYCQVMGQKLLRLVLPDSFIGQNYLNENHKKYSWQSILINEIELDQKKGNKQIDLQIVGVSVNIKKQKALDKRYFQTLAALKIQCIYRMIKAKRILYKMKKDKNIKKLEKYLQYIKIQYDFKQRLKKIKAPIFYKYFKNLSKLKDFKQSKQKYLINTIIQPQLKKIIKGNICKSNFNKQLTSNAIKSIQFYYGIYKGIKQIKYNVKFFNGIKRIQKLYKLRYKILNKKAKIITKALKNYIYNKKRKEFIKGIITFSNVKFISKYITSIKQVISFQNMRLKKYKFTINNYLKSFSVSSKFITLKKVMLIKNMDQFTNIINRILRVMKRRVRTYYFCNIPQYVKIRNLNDKKIKKYLKGFVNCMKFKNLNEKKFSKSIKLYLKTFCNMIKYKQLYDQFHKAIEQQQRTKFTKTQQIISISSKIKSQDIEQIDCLIQFKNSLQPQQTVRLQKPIKFDRYIDFIAKSNKFLQKRRIIRENSRKKKTQKKKK